jgi:hypothetical protein
MSNERSFAVRTLLEQQRHGVLSTLSQRHSGWPFGSVVPYALLASGEPVILISALAEHTRNIVADARVSLFVQDEIAAANPQAGARVTLLGTAAPVSERDLADASRRYLQRFPEASQTAAMGDFTFFKIELQQARFIGGFGEMGWLQRDQLING